MLGDDDVMARKKRVQGFTEDDLNEIAAHIAEALWLHRLVDVKANYKLGDFINEIDGALHVLKKCLKKHKEESS